jgi:PAS domain S-box-containing protein
VTWDARTVDREADQKFAAFRRAVFLALAILGVTVGANLWVYLRESGLLGGLTGRTGIVAVENFLKGYGTWLLPLTAIAGTCGVILLVASLARIAHWQMTAKRRFAAADEELRKATAPLRQQLADARASEDRLKKLGDELEEKVLQMTRSNAQLTRSSEQLQEELDKRRAAERALQQHKQELVRSKDVLELHVQARREQVQKLQQRYELILNSAGEGICGLDTLGKATFVNPAAARITGWEVEELIGRSEQEIFGETTGPDAPATDNQLKEHVFRRKDGSMFPCELIKTSIQENGREVGAVLIFKDITERKQVEQSLSEKAEELARSNAELEQFAFVASHDLQEPLRKIQAFGDRLKTKCETVNLGEGRDYLDRMQGAAARMQTLINDLLAFSRVIRSSQPFVPVDLAAVTREVLGDLEVRIEKTGARMQVGELPKIDADPLQMRQLMQNLISNALKFQPPKAKPIVRIQSRLDEGGAAAAPYYHIFVQDNGIGFDEKYLEKIFAVFQRLHGRSEYEGTGVGLAVCRRIVDRHGGSITARSQPGKGATFIVTLPAQQAASGNSQ